MFEKNLRIASALALAATIPMVESITGKDFDSDWTLPTRRYKSHAKKKSRPVGAKFLEQYQKRYGSIASSKPSKFLGFRKVRKFIPETGMSVWVKV